MSVNQVATAKNTVIQYLVSLANNGRKLMTAIVVNYFACSALYMVAEQQGPIRSMWWALVTGTTVGYGDLYPQTTPGRGIAAWLMLSFWLLTILAAAYVTARLFRDMDEFTHSEQEGIKASLDEIKEMLANK